MVVAAAGVVMLVGVVLMVVNMVMVGVGVVKSTVVIVVVMDLVMDTGLKFTLGVAAGVSVGIICGAVGVKLASLLVDTATAVGDVGAATSAVVLAVGTAGSAEVTVGGVWEVVGKAGGFEGGSTSKINVDASPAVGGT